MDLGQTPCNQTHCSTCEAQLSRLEAWQERCTSEIDSARRRLEHRLQRLEKKLEVQLSEERQLKDKESRDKEYDRVVGRVKDECREVSKNVQDSSGNVKEEIRGLIKGGLSKLELKLGQISRGYNIPFMDCQHRCNPELGRNCSVERGIRHVRSRSSPHLGRAPCEDCVQVLEHRAGGASRMYTPFCNVKCNDFNCPCDQISEFHFFTFSCIIRLSYSPCRISIHYEHQKSVLF